MTRLDSDQEEKLITAAKDLVPALMQYAIAFSEDLQKRARRTVVEKEITNAKLTDEIFFESLYFILHILDRLVFETVGVYKRSVFMDTIFQTISEALSQYSVSEEDFSEALSNYQREYGSFKLLPEKDSKALAGVLPWEFAKRIVMTYGDQNPITVASISYGGLGVIEALQKTLNAIGLRSFA